MIAHQQGRLVEAEAIYRRLMDAVPGLFPPYLMLGMLRLQIGDSMGALPLLDQALKLKPGDPSALLHYGLALHGQKRFEEAVAVYDRLLILQPGLVAAHAARGGAL